MNTVWPNLTIGIVGGGVMAEAILSRLLSGMSIRPEQIYVSDVAVKRLAVLESRYQIQVSNDNAAVVQAAEILLLAIKPQVFSTVGPELAQVCATSTLVLSILAGTPLSRLESEFDQQPVIRAMPNTPATVGAGITAVAAGARVQSTHLDIAQALFAAVGEVVVVPEMLMDAVTGLSGSGPAFVAMVIEALADGGVAAGLPRATSLQLALQTVRGTAELLVQTHNHPALLKDQVASPGGTTIAGVAALEQAGLRSALIQAVMAAYRRSQALGQG
ncbi:pyrroline-5-carboxylate reductase [Synechococcales cyanobacterium C]|uniref:Pyrroline-5-carboxylate reductase n=1 Tax=Petrachloros mirabilis ULC683 TaxID=2781853 RepID=A0A8K2A7L7_9CYAN|nr:pyrroline-5-carboxylate reductase [Petrachloros mirabilis]NCJ07041.1 pyrroline-5-carboxylate reductase [Petrachloros mirabilis ULC683]